MSSRRAITAILGVIFTLSGCMGGCKSGTSTSAADGGLASDVERAASVAKVSRADCERWADHGIDAMFADWKDAASQCTPAVREALAAKLDGQRVSVRGSAVQTCANHLGQSYAAADGQCFLAASTAKGIADCHFAPMTNAGDTDMVSELDRLRASCANQAPAR